VGGGEISRTRPDRPWSPPNLLYSGYRVFPGGKAAGGVAFTHPYLLLRLKKEYSYNFTPPLAFRCFLQGEIKFLLLNKVKLKIIDVGITVVAFKCIRKSSITSSMMIVPRDGRQELEFPQGEIFVFSLLLHFLFRSSRRPFLVASSAIALHHVMRVTAPLIPRCIFLK